MKLRVLIVSVLTATTVAAAETETTPTETTPRSSRGSKTQYFEPVRPISPPPGTRPRPLKSPRPERQPSPVTTRSAETPSATGTASSAAKKPPQSGTAITSAEVADYDTYPVDVRKVLDLGLDLANRNLIYKYNSADPNKGGMDCSGFVYYLLTTSGIKDVPRDARDQYVWARKSGAFQTVLSQRDDTFELDALKPGDLLFWANTYGTDRDPDVTETMIYLGREKGTNQRLMIGASDGRMIKGRQKTGLGVFDFKVGRSKKEGEAGAAFVGYARIPGLATE
jgi:peptidoglycan DL-endopeptidase CwlO